MNTHSFPQGNPPQQQQFGGGSNEEFSIPLPQSREDLNRLYAVSF